MKKRILTLALVAVLALVAIGGATLAYFTDESTATNVITSGNIDIKLDEAKVEYNEDDYTWTALEERIETGVEYENVYPGAVLPKDPTVYNEGSMDAYVRVKVAFPALTDNWAAETAGIGSLLAIEGKDFALGNLETYNLKALFADFDDEAWTVEQTVFAPFFVSKGDTILELTFTLNEKLEAGDEVTLFTAVNVNPEIESALKVQMNVTAEAVQAANFADAEAAFNATFDKPAETEAPETEAPETEANKPL